MSFRDNKIDKSAKVHLKPITLHLDPAVSKTDRVFYLTKPGFGFQVESARQYTHTKAGTVTWSSLIIPNGTGVITAGALTVHSTPEQLALALSKYVVNGKVVEKAAATAITFTAAHVVTALKFGIILVQSDNAGTISTKVPSATQAYDTAGQATAALPSPDSTKVATHSILIEAGALAWTANTSDLTAASDLTARTITAVTAITPWASAITAAASFVEETITVGTAATRKGTASDYLAFIYTTDGSGALTNGTITTLLRARPVGGEV